MWGILCGPILKYLQKRHMFASVRSLEIAKQGFFTFYFSATQAVWLLAPNHWVRCFLGGSPSFFEAPASLSCVDILQGGPRPCPWQALGWHRAPACPQLPSRGRPATGLRSPSPCCAPQLSLTHGTTAQRLCDLGLVF